MPRLSSVPRVGKCVAFTIALGLLVGLGFTSLSIMHGHGSTHDALHGPRTGHRDTMANNLPQSSDNAWTIKVEHGGAVVAIRVDPRGSDDALKEAIATSVGLAPGTFGLQEGDVTVAISPGALTNGAVYNIRTIRTPPCADGQRSDHGVVEHQVKGSFHDEHGVHGLLDSGVVLSGQEARLPRVVVTCLGTGRYRKLAIDALASARTHFGGDCLLSLHLLTDNITAVPREFNAAYIPYREWPMSGLRKFEDILTALETVIAAADYFYFIDGDVRFHENVLLGDVSGDMVAVEHPMYPRHDNGWCVHGKVSMCEYPYERKPQSTAYIPNEWGKFKRQLRGGEKITIANSWYLQSAFWGGKSKFIIPCLKELSQLVDIDISKGVVSSIIQDERYVNWWFWKHLNDSAVNIRWLKNAYLYPFRPTGFGEWVLNASRPIIVHGTAKAGKMIIGEAEIRIVGAGGKAGTCFDSFLHNMIGTYSCHAEEFRGGTQGFIWKDNKLRTSETIKLCADGTGLIENTPVKMGKCTDSVGQLWDYDEENQWIVNRESKLCLDPMRFDRTLYPKAYRKHDWPVHLQKCGSSKYQRVVITFVDVEASKEAAEHKRQQGKY
eukprot:m.40558 g.40558  ORF g.40558 m.40558 type:complete len:607 (-) comp5998_c0_seq1:4148-5968(-)